MYLKVLLAAILTATIGSGALAQFSGSNEGAQQPATGAFGQQELIQQRHNLLRWH